MANPPDQGTPDPGESLTSALREPPAAKPSAGGRVGANLRQTRDHEAPLEPHGDGADDSTDLHCDRPEQYGELEDTDPAETNFVLDAQMELAYFSMMVHDLMGPAEGLRRGIARASMHNAKAGISYDFSDMTSYLDQLSLQLSEVGFLLKYGVFFSEKSPPAVRLPVRDILTYVSTLLREKASWKGKELRVVPSKLSMVTQKSPVCRILQNLAQNAINHSVGTRITIGARKRGNDVVFVVADSGIGIEPHFRRILLGAPHGRSVANASVEGLETRSHGLGLYAVRRLTEELGGHILLPLPRRGRGFIVEVVLPGAARYVPVEPVRMVEGYLESGERPLEGKLIAVLDDDVYATRVLQASFEALGATVRVQHDQHRFLNMLNGWWDSGSSGPDLMVLDFFLESGTVIPVWQEVLKRFGDSPPPAVLLTNALWQSDMSLLTVSMPFLSKPLTSAYMTALVAALIDGTQRSFTHRFQMYETSVSVKTSR